MNIVIQFQSGFRAVVAQEGSEKDAVEQAQKIAEEFAGFRDAVRHGDISPRSNLYAPLALMFALEAVAGDTLFRVERERIEGDEGMVMWQTRVPA